MECSESLDEKASETGVSFMQALVKNHLWVLSTFPGKRLVKGNSLPVELTANIWLLNEFPGRKQGERLLLWWKAVAGNKPEVFKIPIF